MKFGTVGVYLKLSRKFCFDSYLSFINPILHDAQITLFIDILKYGSS